MEDAKYCTSGEAIGAFGMPYKIRVRIKLLIRE